MRQTKGLGKKSDLKKVTEVLISDEGNKKRGKLVTEGQS